MIGYAKYFHSNKTMSFKVSEHKLLELLETYTEIWKKIKGLIGKNFDSEPAHDDQYIKTKINSYGDYKFSR